MADRLLNRVFNAAAAAQEPAASRPEAAVEPSEEEKLRATEVPMQAGDAIARILLAKKDKDWFRRVIPTLHLLLSPACMRRRPLEVGKAVDPAHCSTPASTLACIAAVRKI